MIHQIAVIGCGKRIHALAHHLQWRQLPIRFAAIYDIDRSKAEKFRADRAPDARICATPDEIWRDPAIDWVMVMTPNSTHAEIAVTALRAGKNVFSEKPMAVSFDQCLDILAARRESGKKYMIGFTLRYSPHYRKLREIVASGLIGRPVSMEFNENVLPEHGGHISSCWRRNRETTGFHLLEKCSHDIDIANFILGSIPVKVASFGGLSVFRPENAALLDKYRDADGGSVFCRWPSAKGRNPFTTDKDIVDHQVCILEYRNEVQATFHTNINAPINERRMYICGTEGTLRSDAIGGTIEVKTIDRKTYDFAAGSADDHAGGDQILADTLTGFILGESDTATPIEHGLTSSISCFAIDRAMRENRVVELDDCWKKLAETGGITV